MFKKLVLLTIIWTVLLIMVGAWVRFHEAGLGCPDWPGCYGKITPTAAAASINAEVAVHPNGVVSMSKAWKEMEHRFAAVGLGSLIAAILVWSILRRRHLGLAVALLGVVVFQALLGMWTVTLRVMPVIVTSHLLGAMTTLALLIWLFMAELESKPSPVLGGVCLRRWAALALALVALQISLGGWVSTNYAALACADFPSCNQGQYLPAMDFRHGFQLWRELGYTADGQLLPVAALVAIHWLHRMGALLVLLVVGSLALALGRSWQLRPWAVLLGAVLLVQIALGITMVLWQWPVALAVAHNGCAAVLLAVMVGLNYRVWRAEKVAV